MSDHHPLVCRFGAFGDMVLITPMLKRLYDRCGMPCDIVGIGAWTKTMFEHMPYVRNVHTIKSRKTPYLLSRDKQQLARTLIGHGYANAWVCEQNKKSYQLMRKGHIFNSINALDFPSLPHEHAAEQWLRLANETPSQFNFPPVDEVELNTELFVSDDEISECRNWLETFSIDSSTPIICIQAGNKKTMRAGRIDRDSNAKFWHQKNWAMVIDAVMEHLPEAHVMLCGAPEEYAMTLDIYDVCRIKTRVHCVANDLPLRRLLALLSLAHSCISVDTGPAHAAAALNCPVTVLFGKADARLCSPVSSQSKVIKIFGRVSGCEPDELPESWANCHNIQLITPEQVYEGWITSL